MYTQHRLCERIVAWKCCVLACVKRLFHVKEAERPCEVVQVTAARAARSARCRGQWGRRATLLRLARQRARYPPPPRRLHFLVNKCMYISKIVNVWLTVWSFGLYVVLLAYICMFGRFWASPKAG